MQASGLSNTRTARNPELHYDAFPSVVVPSWKRPDTVPAINAGRRTALIEYDGHVYIVGPDARHELASSDFGRDLTNNYYTSHTYHALMRGALAFMGEERIDVLALGLPMDRFEHPEIIKSLQEHYQGKTIDIGFGRKVEIGQVTINPQPFGGYISLGSHLQAINETFAKYPKAKIGPLKSIDEIRDLNVLIVDTGAYTLDWLFMSPRGPILSASSAANNAGRHRIVRRLYEQISQETGNKPPISILFDIDDAERTGKLIRIDGRTYDFSEEKFQTTIEGAVRDSVGQMFEHLGGNVDRVDLIAVVGGEPKHVANAIAKQRPLIPLFVAPAAGKNQSDFLQSYRIPGLRLSSL